MSSWSFATGTGQVASARHVDDPAYLSASRAIAEENLFHRKHWEWVFIHVTADRHGLLEPGRSALGFGVGTEPLVSAFAARGVGVVATDQPAESAGAWASSNQHASERTALWRERVCDRSVFEQLVSFRAVDMTDLPDDLGVHDLVWSSCCFEHLGSPQAGIEFVRRSMQFVRPGGIAVHTTEFDPSRFRPLKESGSVADGHYVVFYRRREISELILRLREDGFEVEMDWRVSRRHPMERKVDRPPYTHDPHLRVEMAGRVVTSIGLVVRRPL